MLIAIVSDSHGALDRLDALLNNLRGASIKNLIHAGDFAVDGIEAVLKKYPEINFFIAVGNCDVNEEILTGVRGLPNVVLAEIITTEIEGLKFAAAHYENTAKEKVPGAQVYCSGHTHRAKIERLGDKLFLNPGSLMDDGGYFLLNTKNLEIERKLFNAKV